MNLKTLLILLTLSSGWANDIFNEIELSEDTIVEEFEQIDRLTLKNELLKKKKFRKKVFKPTKSTVYEPPVFRALIKKGTVITDQETGKDHSAPRDLYVKARTTHLGSSQSFVLNKNNEVRYTVKTSDTIDLETDLNMDIDIKEDNTSTYQLTRYHDENHKLTFVNRFKIGYEIINSVYFSKLFNNTSRTTSKASRFEDSFYYKSTLPFLFGLDLNLQRGSWEASAGDFTWTALYLGPTIQWTFKDDKYWSHHINTSVTRSVLFKASTSQTRHEFDSTELTFGIGSELKSKIGPILFDFRYRKAKLFLDKTNQSNLTQASARDSVTSYGFYLGYRYDLIL